MEAEEIQGFKATFSAVFRAHLTTGLQLKIENCDCLERCSVAFKVCHICPFCCWQYPRFFSSPGPEDDEKLPRGVVCWDPLVST